MTIIKKQSEVSQLCKSKNEKLIERRVKKIFDSLSSCFNSNGLLDAAKLASVFDFEIVEHNGLPVLINGILTIDINSKQIAINKNLSKDKKRYTIIYLLSTYLLYYQNQDFFIQKHLDANEEIDASYMARLLLVPELILRRHDDKKIQTLANIFQIPYDVMDKRMNDSKMIMKQGKNSVLTKKLVL